jgi:hypothetical protein
LTINESDTSDAEFGLDVNDQLVQKDDYRYVKRMIDYEMDDSVVSRLLEIYKIEQQLNPNINLFDKIRSKQAQR